MENLSNTLGFHVFSQRFSFQESLTSVLFHNRKSRKMQCNTFPFYIIIVLKRVGNLGLSCGFSNVNLRNPETPMQFSTRYHVGNHRLSQASMPRSNGNRSVGRFPWILRVSWVETIGNHRGMVGISTCFLKMEIPCFHPMRIQRKSFTCSMLI